MEDTPPMPESRKAISPASFGKSSIFASPKAISVNSEKAGVAVDSDSIEFVLEGWSAFDISF
jgi:hypothetical protein